MKKMAQEAVAELQNCQNGMFRLIICLNTDSKQVEGRRCLRGSDGKLCFCERERGKVWNNYMERIINKKDDWDHNVYAGAVECPVVCAIRVEVLQALNEIKTGKAPRNAEVILELISVSERVRFQVMADICQRVQNGFGMPDEWALSIVVPVFEWNGDIRNCN